MLCSPPLRVRPGAADPLPIPTPRLLHHRAASPAPSPRPRPRPSSASSSSSRPRTPTPRCAPRGDSTPPRPSRKKVAPIAVAFRTARRRPTPSAPRRASTDARARRGRTPRTFPPAPHAPPRPTRDLTPPRRPAARRGGAGVPPPPRADPSGKNRSPPFARPRSDGGALFVALHLARDGRYFFPPRANEPGGRAIRPEARGRFDRDAISRPPKKVASIPRPPLSKKFLTR